MANGKLVWLNFENIDALTELREPFGVKSPNNVVSILVDLAQKTKNDIRLQEMRVCPTCGKEFEIIDNPSGAYKLKDHIRHSDLEDTTCNKTCRILRRVKLDKNGTTTANDKNNGTNESNDKNSETTDSETDKNNKEKYEYDPTFMSKEDYDNLKKQGVI